MANVLDLLKAKGIAPKRVSTTKGGEYASACPSCGGKDRFRVWPEQNDGQGSWWCRGCNKGGDNIQFLIDFSGMGFKAACRELGREIPEADRSFHRSAPTKPEWTPVQGTTPDGVQADQWQTKARKLVDWAHDQLLQNPQQLAWLADRGIRKETAVRFKLGWNPGEKGRDMFRHRESWGLPTIRKENGQGKKLWIPQGLVIPYIVNQTVQRIRIRRPEGEPRYYVLPGSTMANMLLRSGQKAFAVVESELDAILLDQVAGDLVGVMAIGNSSAKPDAEGYSALKQALCLLVAMDFDAAGAQAWGWWHQQFDRAERWPVPAGKDPGEAFQSGVDLRAWVFAGLPPACRIGCSPLDRKTEGPPKNEVLPNEPGEIKDKGAVAVDKQEGLAELPAAVQRLHELLYLSGIKVLNTQKQTRAIWPRRKCENFAKMNNEIMFLACGDADVWDFLNQHPAPVISSDNFWARGR